DLEAFVSERRTALRRVAQEKAGALEKTRVLGDLASADVAVEERASEFLVACELPEDPLEVGLGVGDLAAAKLAPQRSDVTVEIEVSSVEIAAKRQVERERDRRAPGVVGEPDLVAVRRIGPAGAIEKRREKARIDGRRVPARGRRDEPLDDAPELLRVSIDGDDPCPHERKVLVVAREALREPELARRVGALEIERFERARAQTLDVPGVDDLVRKRPQVPDRVVLERARRREDRRVAMLHAVADDPRSIAGE